MLPQSAADHYREQQRLTVATVAAVRAQWRRMTDDLDSSWRTVGPRIVTLVAAAQLASARNGAASVPRMLAELNIDADPLAEVDPRSLTGVASDGRPLDSLMAGAVVKAKEAQALDAGRSWLDMTVQTQVADAGRVAAGMATTVRPQLSGHVRMLNPPSCSRCAVLAGRVYRWSTGFLRHPRCDCVMVPVQSEQWAQAEGLVSDPVELIRNGQVTDLPDAARRAILDGADVSQVINATTRRGAVYTAGGRQFTREGTTRRGTGIRQRPTPEQIYADAADRDDAVRLLRRFGYVL